MNGSMVKNHISFKTGFGYPATRRTSFLLWFQACQIRLQDLIHQLQGHFQDREVITQHLLQARLHHLRVRPPVLIIQLQRHLQDRRDLVLHLPQARLLRQRQQHQVTMILEKERIELKMIPLQCLCQVSMLMIERRHPLSADSGRASSEILVAARIQEKFGSHASSSHEVSLEPIIKRREDLGKHSVENHFLKDRNCEICQRTKITRAPCRRRNGGAVPRAEIFGDLITADHKVLSENCESRNNHRYAVVVHDLATQWIQAYPCKTKTSQETQRSLQKFLEPDRTPKVTYTDNSLEFGKAFEDLPGIIARLHHTDQKQMGLKEWCAE